MPSIFINGIWQLAASMVSNMAEFEPGVSLFHFWPLRNIQVFAQKYCISIVPQVWIWVDDEPKSILRFSRKTPQLRPRI